ncbi:hypothetical protein LTR64_006194 [Lithohypha guttulata]|uniref:uncharacterized protein n=1 Tax=Lithohypha guttulata TaxID=1690604 RepID=UPI00315D7319
MSPRKLPRPHIAISPARPDASRKRLHSDPLPQRPSTSRSNTSSDLPTLASVREECSDEEKGATQSNKKVDRPVRWDFEKLDPQVLRSMPRFSTTGDLPFLTDNMSSSRLCLLKMSCEELAETFSSAGSSDEDSFVNRGTAKNTSKGTDSGDGGMRSLRRVMSNSSTKIKRMGSKLRRIPSNLLTRSGRLATSDSLGWQAGSDNEVQTRPTLRRQRLISGILESPLCSRGNAQMEPIRV